MIGLTARGMVLLVTGIVVSTSLARYYVQKGDGRDAG